MMIAILSESETDEAAIRILIEAVLGESVDVLQRRLRSRGLHAAVAQIAPTLKELHYRRTAEALAVVVDTDDSPLHQSSQHDDEPCDRDCRLCALRTEVAAVRSSLRPVPEFPPIKAALGVAPPAIEAWLLADSDMHLSETWWELERQRGVRAHSTIRELKQRLYGSRERDAAARLAASEEAARQVAQDISSLEKRFPNSFGPLALDLRSWLS